MEVFIENPDKISDKSVKLFNHILNAHQIWNNRIDQQEKAFEVWGIHNTQDCKSIDKMNIEHSLLTLETFDLYSKIDYTNTNGKYFNNSIRDTLFHVINHSNYHRAQIASNFKQSGITYLVTDYIVYKR